MNSDILKPRDVADIEQAIRWALAEGKALELVGHGTKRAIGRAAQWDMTLAKNTKITERLNVELRWEVYNLLNRANFYYHPQNVLSTCSSVVGSTCASASGGNFGQISQTSDVSVGNPVIAQGGPRNMNFSLKFTF